MKQLKFLVAVFTLTSGLAFAQAKLPTGAEWIQPIDGEILSVEPICPANPSGISCSAIGSLVKVKFTTLGCADKILVVGDQVLLGHTNAKLVLSVLNIHHEASNRIKCYRMPTETHTFYTTYEGSDLEIIYLGVNK
jgi:hypothetical protein